MLQDEGEVKSRESEDEQSDYQVQQRGSPDGLFNLEDAFNQASRLSETAIFELPELIDKMLKTTQDHMKGSALECMNICIDLASKVDAAGWMTATLAKLIQQVKDDQCKARHLLNGAKKFLHGTAEAMDLESCLLIDIFLSEGVA